MRRLACAVVLLCSLSACANGPRLPPTPKLPYPAWYVGFAAPKHMEVWVETVDVLDKRGLAFYRVHGGIASYTGKTEGWHRGGSGGKPINNVDLPNQIFLRWQSLVEPQAYKIKIQIPQWVRDEMVKPERVLCQWNQQWKIDYRETISLGMAPGGIVKAGSAAPAWVSPKSVVFRLKSSPLVPTAVSAKANTYHSNLRTKPTSTSTVFPMEAGNPAMGTHKDCRFNSRVVPPSPRRPHGQSEADCVSRTRRVACAVALLCSLGACANGPRLPPTPKLPYPAWYVGFAAPRHMEVWVETVDVLDKRGLAFYREHGGVASYTGKTEGWHGGGSGGKPINNVDLPDQIFLRWQSLVEPQAYKISIRIPQWMRAEMVRPTEAFCLVPNKWKKKITGTSSPWAWRLEELSRCGLVALV